MLPDADGGREMADGVDALQGAPDGLGVAHVAHLQLGISVEVGRAPGIGSVDLGHQRIQHAHAVAEGQQLVGDVRADEPGAAGDQDVLRHGWSASRRTRGTSRVRPSCTELTQQAPLIPARDPGDDRAGLLRPT